MALTTYSNLKTALDNWLADTSLQTYYDDWITLFEAYLARKLQIRLQETTTILIPATPAALTITGAANNGSGLIRLTMASTSTLTTGNIAGVANVGGTTEANGSWAITVISATTVDLQGSTFTNTYTSGGTLQLPQAQVALPTDYLAWRRVTWTGSPRVDLEYVHPSMLQGYYPTTPADIPRMFTIEGSILKVRPSNATGLEFNYFARPAALSGAVNSIYSNYPDVYLFGSLFEAYMFRKDLENALPWKERRDGAIEEIRLQNFRNPGAMAIRVMGATP